MGTNKNSEIGLLRFITAGNVDDGKSTLIGRLLYDSKSLFDEQYNDARRASEKKGAEEVNLALVTDGLKEERELGITIDVAYRYFSTPNRKFIIADTPGHKEYTRNMVTAASQAQLTTILIDARKGVMEQTKRHTLLSSLLGISHVVVCINKMDLVEYEEQVFNSIREQFIKFSADLNIESIVFIPMAGLHGDNVVNKSEKMLWYKGSSLLHFLETVEIKNNTNYSAGRFPVQFVLETSNGYKGLAGKVAGGVFRKGDIVKVLPSEESTTITKIDTHDGDLDSAFPPHSVSLVLADNIDIQRGDMLVHANSIPTVSNIIEGMICWFNEIPLQGSTSYLLKHTTAEAKAVVKKVAYKLDVNTLEKSYANLAVHMNDIAYVNIELSKSVYTDTYLSNRITGSFILIDAQTNETVAAGMIQ